MSSSHFDCIYGCETGTINKDLEKSILAFENNCYRLLQVQYTTHITKVKINGRVAEHIGNYDMLLDIVKIYEDQMVWPFS